MGTTRQALALEIEKRDIDTETYRVDAMPIDPDERFAELTPSILVTVPDGLLTPYVDALTRAGLEPLVADTAAGALSHALDASAYSASDKTIMLLHLGMTTTVHVTAHGHFAFARDFTMNLKGGNSISVNAGAAAVSEAVQMWSDFVPAKPLDRLLVSGTAEDLDAIVANAARQIETPVALFDPFSGIRLQGRYEALSPEQRARAAIAVGLAHRFENEY